MTGREEKPGDEPGFSALRKRPRTVQITLRQPRLGFASTASVYFDLRYCPPSQGSPCRPAFTFVLIFIAVFSFPLKIEVDCGKSRRLPIQAKKTGEIASRKMFFRQLTSSIRIICPDHSAARVIWAVKCAPHSVAGPLRRKLARAGRILLLTAVPQSPASRDPADCCTARTTNPSDHFPCGACAPGLSGA